MAHTPLGTTHAHKHAKQKRKTRIYTPGKRHWCAALSGPSTLKIVPLPLCTKNVGVWWGKYYSYFTVVQEKIGDMHVNLKSIEVIC